MPKLPGRIRSTPVPEGTQGPVYTTRKHLRCPKPQTTQGYYDNPVGDRRAWYFTEPCVELLENPAHQTTDHSGRLAKVSGSQTESRSSSQYLERLRHAGAVLGTSRPQNFGEADKTFSHRRLGFQEL